MTHPTPSILAHELDGDPLTCWTCENESDDPDICGNAHTLVDYLRETKDAPRGFAAAWVEAVAPLARVCVAEVADGDVLCWCGHTLHYPDCACDSGPDGLTCGKRYALETADDDERATLTLDHVARLMHGDEAVPGCPVCDGLMAE